MPIRGRRIRRTLELLRIDDPERDALRRAVRAAIVLPLTTCGRIHCRRCGRHRAPRCRHSRCRRDGGNADFGDFVVFCVVLRSARWPPCGCSHLRCAGPSPEPATAAQLPTGVHADSRFGVDSVPFVDPGHAWAHFGPLQRRNHYTSTGTHTKGTADDRQPAGKSMSGTNAPTRPATGPHFEHHQCLEVACIECGEKFGEDGALHFGSVAETLTAIAPTGTLVGNRRPLHSQRLAGGRGATHCANAV
jgi:hypothetical protein